MRRIALLALILGGCDSALTVPAPDAGFDAVEAGSSVGVDQGASTKETNDARCLPCTIAMDATWARYASQATVVYEKHDRAAGLPTVGTICYATIDGSPIYGQWRVVDSNSIALSEASVDCAR